MKIKKQDECQDCKNAYNEVCRECCQHDEHDHGYCLSCDSDLTELLVGAGEDMSDILKER